MALRDSLGDRMKGNYENRAKFVLTRRTPVIIRLDGKAFHTFTKHLQKPYDNVFHDAMNATTKYLCENIQGCKFGYTQSDEITLVLTDCDTLATDAWFDYEVQKMCSISAAMATFAFNRFFSRGVAHKMFVLPEGDDYVGHLQRAVERGAMFDSRCFNIPEDEVCNNFIWRQNDATRNAIRMLGYCYYSSKELEGVDNDKLQDMLFTEHGVNFNDFPTNFKRGVCCYREDGRWIIDENCPIFTQDREYIAKHIVKTYN